MGILKFNDIELVNVLIVFGLGLVLLRKRDVVTLLFVLFVCGTFHFSFAVMALTTNDASRLLIDLHNEGGGLLARLSTLILLVIVFSLLGRHAYETYVSGRAGEKKDIVFALLVMGMLLLGYLLNYRTGDLLQLKNIVSIETMFVLVMLGYLATAAGVPSLQPGKVYAWGLVGLLILGIIDGIALYEVLTRHAWASFLESSGAIVYRAASVLFNPNLYAFWASLVYLGCAYGMQAYKQYQWMFLLGMVLVATAIYLSGSRSAGYLLMALLFLPPALIRKRLQWLPLLVLLLTMLSIYSGVACLGYASWQEITLLGERFVAAPIHLVNYIFQYIGIPAEIVVLKEIAVSIEGRFVGEYSDAGWLVLYQDVGWTGLGAVILGGGLLVVRGIGAYLAHPSPASVYALVLLLYCLITGFVTRLQIFPVWLFIGLALIICMGYWRELLIAPDKAVS
ncbi:MAG: hypothetical protein ABIG35_01555 [Pseudomonadota bacterium]